MSDMITGMPEKNYQSTIQQSSNQAIKQSVNKKKHARALPHPPLACMSAFAFSCNCTWREQWQHGDGTAAVSGGTQ